MKTAHNPHPTGHEAEPFNRTNDSTEEANCAILSKKSRGYHMNRNRSLPLLLLVFFLLAVPFPGLCFTVGEKLVYSIYANNVKVGYQLIELSSIERLDGREVYKLTGHSKSAGFISIFYRLDDKWVIYLDSRTLRPVRVEKDQLEGKRTGFIVSDIDQETRTVTIRNVTKQTSKSVKGENDIYDFISMVYHFRRSAALYKKQGDSLTFDFLESSRITTVTFENTGSDTMKTRKLYRRKEFDVTRYSQSPDAGIEFYIADDPTHLPLKMYAQAQINKRSSIDIEIYLTEYTGGR